MALPGSGTITWEMIRAEFGGGYPIYMSQYYRGGGRVPNVGANANVPTSGAIGAWHFYNATNSSIAKSGDASGSIFDPEPAPGSATVTTNTVTISGAGLSSVSWSLIAGSTFTVNQSGLNASFSASVPKNSGGKSAVYRATGNNGLFVDVNVFVDYTTDL